MLNNYSGTPPPHFDSAKIILFDDLTDCVDLALSYVQKGAIALAAGSTLSRLYALMALKGSDSSAASFFPLDERCVPLDNPGSNWGLITSTFLSAIGKSSDQAHWGIDAESFEKIVRRFFGERTPQFDSILMSMGDDGHVASLFPHSDSLADMQSIVLATKSPKPPYERYTLGPRLIACAHKVLLFIEGEAKRAVVAKFLQGDLGIPAYSLLHNRTESTVLIHRSLVE